MKKILIIGVLLFVVLVVAFRQRIFVRDPLGKVDKNNVLQDEARLYINYSNDVLVEDSVRHQFILVQSGSALPGVPQRLTCLTGLVCLTDADTASVFPMEGVGGRTPAVMSPTGIAFVDESGASVTVNLR